MTFLNRVHRAIEEFKSPHEFNVMDLVSKELLTSDTWYVMRLSFKLNDKKRIEWINNITVVLRSGLKETRMFSKALTKKEIQKLKRSME